MSKKLHVDCFLVGNGQVEAFRQLVRAYNEPAGGYEEYQASGFVEPEPSVEILYEESGRDTTGFDLWFATPATGYYFGLKWGQRRAELHAETELAAYRAQVAAELRKLMLQAIYPSFDAKRQQEEGYIGAEQYVEQLAAALGVSTGPPVPTYPQFRYHPKLRTWLRYNSPDYFCLVSETNLQVRRERPQELFKPEEVEVVTEAAFLAEYRRISTLLQERAEQFIATYQRRGGEGNEWFYCNYIYAGGSASLEKHLRLNVSVNEQGRCWQLLYDYDLNGNDQRRVASTQEEFAQQLQELLREAEAAATGQEVGQPKREEPL